MQHFSPGIVLFQVDSALSTKNDGSLNGLMRVKIMSSSLSLSYSIIIIIFNTQWEIFGTMCKTTKMISTIITKTPIEVISFMSDAKLI